MSTDALTTDQNAFDAAILRGVDYVSYGGDQIEYRSLPDMISVRDLLRHEFGMSSGRPRIRSRRIAFKGFR